MQLLCPRVTGNDPHETSGRCGSLGGLAAIGLAVCTLLASGMAGAVLIGSGDGRGNVVAPAEDPGWHNVGTKVRNGKNVVYLGDGWVLTAKHLGFEAVRIAGVEYQVVEGSNRQLLNDDSTRADLLLYRIAGNPSLPELPRLQIASSTPQVGEPVVMIGRGRDRGPPVVREVAVGRWVEGWAWGPQVTLRWGTNRIAQAGRRIAMGHTVTQAIVTQFQPPPDATPFEAQAVAGDSGGAVFARAPAKPTLVESDKVEPGPGSGPGDGDGDGGWELVGVMFAISSNLEKSDDVSVYGSATYAADLAHYRDQILSIVNGTPVSPSATLGLSPTLGPRAPGRH